MSRRCMVTGKSVMSGNNVSHSNRKTKRKFYPNVQECSLYSEVLGRRIRLKISAAGLRTVDHKGGLDAWLAGTAPSKLDPELRPVRALIQKALSEKQTAAKTGQQKQ